MNYPAGILMTVIFLGIGTLLIVVRVPIARINAAAQKAAWGRLGQLAGSAGPVTYVVLGIFSLLLGSGLLVVLITTAIGAAA